MNKIEIMANIIQITLTLTISLYVVCFATRTRYTFVQLYDPVVRVTCPVGTINDTIYWIIPPNTEITSVNTNWINVENVSYSNNRRYACSTNADFTAYAVNKVIVLRNRSKYTVPKNITCNSDIKSNYIINWRAHMLSSESHVYLFGKILPNFEDMISTSNGIVLAFNKKSRYTGTFVCSVYTDTLVLLDQTGYDVTFNTPCDTDPSHCGRGNCEIDDDTYEVYCKCPPMYVGKRCDIKLDDAKFVTQMYRMTIGMCACILLLILGIIKCCHYRTIRRKRCTAVKPFPLPGPVTSVFGIAVVDNALYVLREPIDTDIQSIEKYDILSGNLMSTIPVRGLSVCTSNKLSAWCNILFVNDFVNDRIYSLDDDNISSWAEPGGPSSIKVIRNKSALIITCTRSSNIIGYDLSGSFNKLFQFNLSDIVTTTVLVPVCTLIDYTNSLRVIAIDTTCTPVRYNMLLILNELSSYINLTSDCVSSRITDMTCNTPCVFVSDCCNNNIIAWYVGDINRPRIIISEFDKISLCNPSCITTDTDNNLLYVGELTNSDKSNGGRILMCDISSYGT